MTVLYHSKQQIFNKKYLPFAVCEAVGETHFGGSRTSPLQERKQSQSQTVGIFVGSADKSAFALLSAK